MTIQSNPHEVAHWIRERENARLGKCNDEIIKTYKFCNVHREDDRVTRWLKKHWRDPHWEADYFVDYMVLARMVNWPPTLERIGPPRHVWCEEYLVREIHEQAKLGKAWSSAYLITTCGVPMDKASYCVRTARAAGQATGVLPAGRNSIRQVWSTLASTNGLGAGFIAGQVVADLKYTPILNKAEDWWTFAVPGPGSKRGLNRYFNRHPKYSWHGEEWERGFRIMMDEVSPLLGPDVAKLHAQDWQNVMCEYDKWKRVKHGEGRPKSYYRPETAYQV